VRKFDEIPPGNWNALIGSNENHNWSNRKAEIWSFLPKRDFLLWNWGSRVQMRFAAKARQAARYMFGLVIVMLLIGNARSATSQQGVAWFVA
jgi:hypothetical protein